jgi:hypothetical protein
MEARAIFYSQIKIWFSVLALILLKAMTTTGIEAALAQYLPLL